MALIINAQMPKGCEWADKTSRTGMGYCPLKEKCTAYKEELSKQYTINAHPIDFIPSDCPIIGEIPDSHGRLIDADALIEKTRMWSLVRGDKYFELRVKNAIVKEILDASPTIVEATE